MDRRWLAECNYIHWGNPSEEQGQVLTVADFTACGDKLKEGVARGRIWYGHLALDPPKYTDKSLSPRRPSGPPPDVITPRQVHRAGRGHRVQKGPLLVFL